MEKMEIYEQAKKCPNTALKEIKGGRLKGMSDINPMWRIKKLTELFGACGIGWYYDIDKQWIETGAKGEVSAFCNISLYIKVGGDWSKPIKGTGGAAFIACEKAGPYTDDECFKKALTDAISVACKALGFAADVYWNADRTKYDQPQQQPQQPQQPQQKMISSTTIKIIEDLIAQTGSNRDELLKYYHVQAIGDMSQDAAKHCVGVLKGRLNG